MSEEPLLKEQTAKNTHAVTCHNTRGRSQAHGREVQTLVHVRRTEAGAGNRAEGRVCTKDLENGLHLNNYSYIETFMSCACYTLCVH